MHQLSNRAPKALATWVESETMPHSKNPEVIRIASGDIQRVLLKQIDILIENPNAEPIFVRVHRNSVAVSNRRPANYGRPKK
jgi:hypothetical protein